MISPAGTRAGTRAVTVGAAISDAARRLADCGVENARLDARLLVGHVLGVGAEAVAFYPERAMDRGARGRLADLLARRAGREPLAKILGRREFWSLSFKITADTLDPRPDSETVVLSALDAVRGRFGPTQGPLRILDLGTGSGCLLLALLHELPKASGVGVDRSVAAVAVARENAESLGLANRASFFAGNWGAGIDGVFDCIVANPPYIRDSEIATLAPEVARFEARPALSGGDDGLDCYRAIASQLPRLLAPLGTAAVEIGAGQAEAVAGIFRRNGLSIAGIDRDLAGRERCVKATL